MILTSTLSFPGSNLCFGVFFVQNNFIPTLTENVYKATGIQHEYLNPRPQGKIIIDSSTHIY